MKKFILTSVALLVYIAPILAIYLQIKGAKKLYHKLEEIREAIEFRNMRKIYNDMERYYHSVPSGTDIDSGN